MKKNILIALFALLAVALNGNAQNNTYNMVIEMANGTKITIGPNDVKNISFNNGELVMTGEDINSLVEQQNKADMRIDSLAEANKQNYNQLLAMLATVEHYLANGVYNKEEIDALLANIQGGGTPDLSNYATKADLQAILEMINTIRSCQCDMSGLLARLEKVETMFENYARIDMVYAYREELLQLIGELNAKIIEMQKTIDELNQKVQ